MRNLLRGIAVTVAALTFAYSVTAQNTQPPRMRGTVTAIDGRDLSVSIGDGAIAKIRLNDDWSVVEASRLDPAKIPVGSFVGAGAAKLPDGSLRAVQVIIFPAATNEGARPWDVVPNGQMTNAPVTANVTAARGPVLTLTTGGKSYDVNVPPDALVVLYENGSRDLIKTGANISFAANRAPDGTMTAGRIVVGKNGSVPPI